MSQSSELALSLLGSLEKPPVQGSYIPAEKIEPIVGVERTHADYSIRCNNVRVALERIIEGQTGRLYMTRQANGGIRFLTTSEAAKHGMSMFKASRHRMDLWHSRTCVVVDKYMEEMDDNERQHYEDQRHFNARLLLHMKEMELGENGGKGEENETT